MRDVLLMSHLTEKIPLLYVSAQQIGVGLTARARCVAGRGSGLGSRSRSRAFGRYCATICALERYRVMGKFDYDAPAELFAGGGGIRSKGNVRYLRFDCAAKAIQYAIEQIPLGQRSRSVLEVGEERYESAIIQKLYVSTEYPLDRSYPSVF